MGERAKGGKTREIALEQKKPFSPSPGSPPPPSPNPKSLFLWVPSACCGQVRFGFFGGKARERAGWDGGWMVAGRGRE